ncbi:GNAT family N-acetyltransferase [Clostridium sp. JN-9]|uniref:GNAT family N-acetyltransferase n=1 Tax=Clostridium sp. JN-9 TaxID=2507159 RepID=UPI000FFDF7B6|nr:GNAT family N-acetyltransferase [Clostridium sp. JN-9]QAT39871.1 N-acetyltransferase [Clostridium sp. JN-9]
MDERFYLHVPSFEELGYRQKILAQPDTMAYNRGYELGFENYDNETGCIDFRKEYWKEWFSRWVNNTPDKYYAYIIKSGENIPIGEVALHYDDSENGYCVNIIIEAKYRGNGYSGEALRLLIDVGFHKLNAKRIFDTFSNERVSAEKTFKKVGFKRISDDMLELTRD